jgi:hypothetical protein
MWFHFFFRFVNVGPAASNISESVDSLAYGDLVKNITNEKVSADADMEEQLRFLQVQRQNHRTRKQQDGKGTREGRSGRRVIGWISVLNAGFELMRVL